MWAGHSDVNSMLWPCTGIALQLRIYRCNLETIMSAGPMGGGARSQPRASTRDIPMHSRHSDGDWAYTHEPGAVDISTYPGGSDIWHSTVDILT